MRKLVLPFTILMVVSLSGCKKDSLVVVNGICQGYVRDSYSNIPIPGAKINYMIGEKSDSATTDTNGFFVIKGLPAGDTRLIISKVGYAGYLTDTWIEPLYAPASVKGGGSVDSYDEVSVTLPELTGSISGTILKTIGSNNEVRPAAGFDIIVTYDNYYSPSYFSTTTDSKGAFSLSNLPAMYSTVVVKPHSDADNYYYYSTSINLYPNTTSEWYYTLGHSDKGIYLVSTSLDIGNGIYTHTFPVGDNIVLTFSKAVSAENTKTFGYINISGGVTLNLDTDVTFSGSSVTINPPSDLTNATTYTLSFRIYSQTPGDYVDKSIQFVTEN